MILLISDSETLVKQKIDCPAMKQLNKNQKTFNYDKEYICNELLCFIQNKMDILPQPMVIKSAVDFYNDLEIKAAKDLLFDMCANFTNPPMRNTGRTGSGKNGKHLADIYALLARVPSDKLPIFTAANLARLPPIDLDCFDMGTLSQQVKEIRKVVKAENDMSNLVTEFPVLKAQLNELLGMKTEFDMMKRELQLLSQVKNATTVMPCVPLSPKTLLTSQQSTNITPSSLSLGPQNRNQPQCSANNAPTHSSHTPYADALLSKSPSKAQNMPPGSPKPKKSDQPIEQAAKDKSMDTYLGVQTHDLVRSDQNENFTVVQRRKKRPPVIGKKNDSALSVIKGKRSCLFISRLSPTSTPEDIESFIRSSFNVSQLRSEKLKTRHDGYSSFRVDMFVTDSTDVLSPDNWPDGVLIRKFFSARQSPNSH